MAISIDEVIALISSTKMKGDPNELTALYKKLEGVDLPSVYLVDKARAIQLSEGDEYLLEDAEVALKRAILIDPACLEAYLELGYFYYAINDSPRMALDVFSEGIKRVKAINTALDLGRAKVLAELGEIGAALNIVNDPKYQELQEFEILGHEIRAPKEK